MIVVLVMEGLSDEEGILYVFQEADKTPLDRQGRSGVSHKVSRLIQKRSSCQATVRSRPQETVCPNTK
jgi:hypothetical protein